METFAESTPSQRHVVEPKSVRNESERTPFFGPLPTRGIWTALGLTRGQFFLILTVSVAMFLFLYGPLWLHTHESHFGRIVWSYLVILPMSWAALYRNGKAHIGTIVAASVVIGLVKLVLTAVILVVIGLGQA
jgi:hypothetical protein